jgi:hypothetical protein
MNKKPDTASRMADILSAKRLADLKADAPPPSPAPPDPPAPLPAKPVTKAPATEVNQPSPRGRPLGSKNAKAGKKSDEDYCPTTIYIRKETRKRVKQALLDAETTEDVSDLVESLLQEWLENRR